MFKGSDTNLYLCVFAVSLMCLVDGLFQAWPSCMLPVLLDKNSPIPINSDQSIWVTSFLAIGVLVSALPTGWLCSRLGSKRILLCAVAPALLSIQLTVMAESFVMLLFCRLLAGFALGMSMTAIPAYLTDISRNSNRGFTGVISRLGSNLGMLLAYSLGPYIEFRQYQLVCSLAPILFIVIFIWVPESPYYLLSQGRYEEATNALVTLRGYKTLSEAENELQQMRLNLEVSGKSKGRFRDLFRTKVNRRASVIFLVMVSLMLWSGHSVILSYAGMIFSKSGSSIDSNLSAIILGAFQLVTGIVSSFMVDKFGRRPLMIFSSFGTAVALLPESVYFLMKDVLNDDLDDFSWVPLVFMIVFVITFGVGLGVLPLVIASEIFPQDVKGIALAFGAVYACTAALAVTQIYLNLENSVGIEFSFMISAVCCIIGGLYLTVYLPETKGKSLREITAIMSGEKDNLTDSESVHSQKNSVNL